MAIIMVQLVSMTALASEVKSNDDQFSDEFVMFEYIMSNEVIDIIKTNIDLSIEGTQSVYVGNGIMFSITTDTSNQMQIKSDSLVAISSQTATGKVSGYFYTVKDNVTVAEYSLEAKFSYNGSSVNHVSSEISSSTTNNNWRLDDIKEVYESNTQMIVSGRWTLYYKTGALFWTKYEYNNNTHIDIICSRNGVITYNYK
jgi:hypothetical protein